MLASEKECHDACAWANRVGYHAPFKSVCRPPGISACRNPGLNQGPLDLQSNALPTELFRPTTHTWPSAHSRPFRPATASSVCAEPVAGRAICRQVEVQRISSTPIGKPTSIGLCGTASTSQSHILALCGLARWCATKLTLQPGILALDCSGHLEVSLCHLDTTGGAPRQNI